LMLDWERWTLTHSSGEAGALVLLLPGLLLPPVLLPVPVLLPGPLLPPALLPVPVPVLLGLGLVAT
jgi:hypothetical protein